jgi:hypothetical protein
MALQKIFLLPPLKGLNLYDNPFTMSPDYAVELVNFMPPTTTFTVRPGIEHLTSIVGQVKGIFSYNVGVTKDYGKYWYLSTIKYAAANYLLIKTFREHVDDNSKTYLMGYDTINNEFYNFGEIENSVYNDDNALYRHTIFFTSGSSNSTMYLYHLNKGLKKFCLCIGEDGHQEIGDIQNITIFKDFIFMSSTSSLNIYFLATKYADILDPINSAFWKSVENLFSPHFGNTFSLDGIIEKGGSIIKLANISKSGADTINTYLIAITDNGEIVLYDGTDPSDTTGAKWTVAGKFQIPPPLNKFCFVEMEGDLIVATKNGLLSLRRIIFGQASQITENLEYRLLSLFTQYMFSIPSFIQYISLNYHPKNRLLIFNIPIMLPMQFNELITSFVFDKDNVIMFPQTISHSYLEKLKEFIINFIYRYYLDYSFIIEFNGDYNNNNIRVQFDSKIITTDNSVLTNVNFYACINGQTINFFNKPIVFKLKNIADRVKIVTLESSDIYWSDDIKHDWDGHLQYYFNLTKEDDKQFIVTNMFTKKSFFYNGSADETTLSDINVSESLVKYNFMQIQDSIFPLDFNTGLTIYQYFNLLQYNQNNISFSDANISIFLDNTKRQISLVKVAIKAFMQNKDNFKDKLSSQDETHKAILTCNIVPNFIYQRQKIPINLSFKIGMQTVKSNNIVEKGFAYVWMDLNLSFLWLNKTYGYSVSFPESLMDCNSTSSKFFHCGYSSREISVSLNNIPSYIFENMGGSLERLEYDGSITFTEEVAGSQWIEPLKQSIINVFNAQILNYNNSFSYLLAPFLLSENKISATESATASPTAVNMDELFSITLPMSSIPIFNDLNIMGKFKSVQYVFDSHFGTWSSFKDINMIKGVEHNNEFYFIVPKDIKFVNNSMIVSGSDLFKFKESQLGDYDVTTNALIPINVTYKTVDTFDFGVPNKKYLKRIKLFGTPSAFWEPKMYPTQKLPLTITPYFDFKEGQTVSFVHAFDSLSVSQKALRKLLISAKLNKEVSQEQTYAAIAELSFVDKKKFWEMYVAENDMIAQVSFPLIASSGTRFGLELNMEIREAYIDIYGFEIFFETANSISL